MPAIQEPLPTTSHQDSILAKFKSSVFRAFLFIMRLVLTICSSFSKKANHIEYYFTLSQYIYDESNRTKLMEILNEHCRKYSETGLLKFTLLFKSMIILYNPKTVKVVLGNRNMINKAEQYQLLFSAIGQGLISSSGTKWKNRRRLLGSSFHMNRVKNFIPVFQECSRVLVKRIEGLLPEPWLDVTELTLDCSLDMICKVALDASINCQKGEHIEYRKAIFEMGGIFVYRLIRPWLYPDFIFNCTSQGRLFNRFLKILKGFTKKMIIEKKVQMLSAKRILDTPDEYEDIVHERNKMFLELLLEFHLQDPHSFTEEDVQEEVDTFVTAGFETSGRSMGFVIFMIGLYEDVQREIHKELDDIFWDDAERDVTLDDTLLMKYLEAVIKETLRLYPPVPFLARTIEEDCKILDYKISKGTFCVLYTYMLHRNEEYFPDPEKFDPERFLPENSHEIPSYAYIPFSAGPRNCLGEKFAMLEMKIVLSNIFRKYKVTSVNSRESVKVFPALVLGITETLRVRFQRR